MIVYILAIMPSFLSSIHSRVIEKGNRRAVFWLFLPLIFLIALRGIYVGADTFAYSRIYKLMSNGTFILERSYDRMEYGFKALVFLLTRISHNPQTLFIIQALFCGAVLISFVANNTNYPGYFILLFTGLNLFTFYITGVRQSFAMAICLIAYQKCINGKKLQFFIYVLIAYLFHRSAMLFILAYFFITQRVTKLKVLFYIIVFALLPIYADRLFAFSSELVDYTYFVGNVQSGYIMTGIFGIVTALSYLNINRLLDTNSINNTLIQMNTATMVFWILRFFTPSAERMALYFTPFSFLLIINLIGLVENNNKRVLFTSISSVVLVAYFIYRLGALNLIPYEFFWRNPI